MRPSAHAVFLTFLIALAALSLAPAPPPSRAHAGNAIYAALLRDGLTLAGTHIDFPEPLTRDGDSVEAERAALRKLAGSDSAVQELLRNSVAAPQILKLRDEKAADGTMIRIGSIWFAVHAPLGAIDPAQLGGRKTDGEPVEAGNMRFASHLLNDSELKERSIERKDPHLEWFTHLNGDMLDRIHLEATDHAVATQTEDSWVFATRTDTRFDDDPKYPNHWWPLERGGKPKGGAAPQRYNGGASTTRIGRLASAPGVLLVEGHFAFAEPHAWFDGGPILRSKISLVAQDQIRRLRRELAKRQSTP